MKKKKKTRKKKKSEIQVEKLRIYTFKERKIGRKKASDMGSVGFKIKTLHFPISALLPFGLLILSSSLAAAHD